MRVRLPSVPPAAPQHGPRAFLSACVFWRQMTDAEPMSPLVANLMPSLVMLSSTGSAGEVEMCEEQEGLD